MEKIKIGVVFGGMSTENEVSCMSAKSVVKNLNKDKYEIYPIYINKEGEWFKAETFEVEENWIDKTIKIDNIVEYLNAFNVIFPVLHGLFGEDGTIQGMFELLKIPYVGCGVLASSVGMDKIYTKIVFDKAGINQTKCIYLRKYNKQYIYVDDDFEEEIMNLDEAANRIEENSKYPLFIKPSNSGSSVGVMKANNKEELKNAIDNAGKYDKKILVEEEIVGREVECAVLGNEDVIASCVGEIKAADEFYSFDAKYNNSESKTVIPADITEEKEKEIQKLAIKAFKSIDGKGLSRVDFFIENNTNKIYLNEINTLPGFTNISMYPKLFNQVGIPYDELLDRLIMLALEK